MCAVFLPCLLLAALPAQRLDPEAAADFSAAHRGLAVLVYEDGELTFERYDNGHSADKAHHIFSGTKSFAPIVALIAQREGLLELDEKVSDTITEWRGDERKERITVRHLLNFTSGLRNIDDQLHSLRAPDKYGASIACDCVREPGTRFRYGSNHLMVFGEFFERKLRAAETDDEKLPKDFVAYLKLKVLEPIGCKYTSWLRDYKGNPALPYGAYLTAREWAKFGLLVLNRGAWQGEQIVPLEHFDECFRGSEANGRYGLNFWLIGASAHKRNARIPNDTVTAAGMRGQKLYIMPSKQLLVVRLGNTQGRFDDVGFLTALLGEGGDDDDGEQRK